MENFNNGTGDQYFQFPPLMIKDDLKDLLKPGSGLLSVMAIILRFGDRWISERSSYSYNFWEGMFSLNTFYEYALQFLLSLDLSDETRNESKSEMNALVEQSNIMLKSQVKKVIHEYLDEKISYNALKTFLEGFHAWEFFYRIKPGEITPMNFDMVEGLVNDKIQLKEFLRKLTKMVKIMQAWIYYYLKHATTMDETVKNAVLNFNSQLMGLKMVLEYKIPKMTREKKAWIEYEVLFLVLLYNIFIRFLLKCFKFDQGKVKR